MDCGLLDSSVYGILQARILEWVAISLSRGSSWPRNWNQVSCIAGRVFTSWATGEALFWDWLVWTPCCPGDSQQSSPAPQFEGISSSVLSLLHGLTVTSVHDYWKIRALTISIFVSRVLPLLFNTLSRCVIAFLPRSKHLLISWLQSPSTVIFEPKKIRSVTASTFSPFI